MVYSPPQNAQAQNALDDTHQQSDHFSTLIELLQHRAKTQPNDLAYQFLVDGKSEGAAYTYAELD